MSSNKTTNYDLPQWEKDDFIQMDDFNAAFSKIDEKLKANAEAASQSVTAEAQARAEADAALTETIIAAEQNIKLVSLGAPRTTEAENGSIVFDLSALNMADYRAFLVFASVEATTFTKDGQITLLCDSASLGLIADSDGGHASSVAWVFPAAKGVGAGFHAPTQNRSSAASSSGSIINESANWNTMQSLTFQFTGKAGASVALYGLKA